ncbi:hypothetical protein GPN2_13036 [Streptomyces murinus]
MPRITRCPVGSARTPSPCAFCGRAVCRWTGPPPRSACTRWSRAPRRPSYCWCSWRSRRLAAPGRAGAGRAAAAAGRGGRGRGGHRGGVLLTVVRPLRRPVTGLVRTALADVRVVHARPCRVLALWGGAVAMPLVQAGALGCVGAALGLGLSFAEVALAFLAAGTAVGAARCPAGSRWTRRWCGRWSPSARSPPPRRRP